MTFLKILDLRKHEHEERLKVRSYCTWVCFIWKREVGTNGNTKIVGLWNFEHATLFSNAKMLEGEYVKL